MIPEEAFGPHWQNSLKQEKPESQEIGREPLEILQGWLRTHRDLGVREQVARERRALEACGVGCGGQDGLASGAEKEPSPGRWGLSVSPQGPQPDF